MESDDRCFTVDPKKVVCDMVDDEAILIQIETGNYFSLRGSGAEMWRLLAAGLSERAVVSALGDAFDAPAEPLGAALGTLVERLVDEGLLTPTERAEIPRVAVPAVPAPRRRFEPPTLEKFSDMADLLLLDPIHEVDPAKGWPAPQSGRA